MNIRSSLFVRQALAGVLPLLAGLARAEAVSAESAPTTVNFVYSQIAVLTAPNDVVYDSTWVDEPGATAEIVKTVNIGTEGEHSSLVYSSAAGEKGVYELTLDADDHGTARLVHRIVKGGETLSECVRDIAIGAVSAPSAASVYDSRPDSLAKVAKDRPAALPLVYSTSWAPGAVTCRIVASTHPVGAAEPVTVETVETLSGEGVYDWSGYRAEIGLRALSLTMLDAGGQAIGDPLLVGEFKVSSGMMLFLR